MTVFNIKYYATVSYVSIVTDIYYFPVFQHFKETILKIIDSYGIDSTGMTMTLQQRALLCLLSISLGLYVSVLFGKFTIQVTLPSGKNSLLYTYITIYDLLLCTTKLFIYILFSFAFIKYIHTYFSIIYYGLYQIFYSNFT